MGICGVKSKSGNCIIQKSNSSNPEENKEKINESKTMTPLKGSMGVTASTSLDSNMNKNSPLPRLPPKPEPPLQTKTSIIQEDQNSIN